MKTTFNPEYKLASILQEMEEAGVLEDRREYCPEDLKLSHYLTDQEANDLYYRIQRMFTKAPKFSPSQIPSWIFKEYFLESEHAGWEGYSESEQTTIMKLLDDLSQYWENAKDDKGRDPVSGRVPNSTLGSEESDQ